MSDISSQYSIEAFANIGRMLGSLHTAMVEFGMRRVDANVITAAVIRKLLTPESEPEGDASDP